MNDGTIDKNHIRYLFGDWVDELVLAASDADECCITSAYLNTASIPMLQEIAQQTAVYSVFSRYHLFH